ncbi:zinc carboxypeptidase [Pseudonocardiaceae bacterium YIM PH 21723]|nr:zinc carboxypeptidase [Pseudonocardiaceae bacterium YIM PH 21723]
MVVAAVAAGVGWRASSAQPTGEELGVYQVTGLTDAAQRKRLSVLGLDIVGHTADTATVVATQGEAEGLRRSGLTSRYQGTAREFYRYPAGRARGYHDYDSALAQLRDQVSRHPAIARLADIGNSFEGRPIPLMKISDNAGADEGEPEVVLTCNIHAREHLTAEMCLHVVDRYLAGYGTDPAITDLVNGRVLWVLPMVNPDGSEYDKDQQGWRKNRESPAVDLNRNFGHQWGCCQGSSADPESSTYRGEQAFSATETRRIRDFVHSRVIGGRQRIAAHIDFHTFGEMVGWPFGYTAAATGPGMSADEARTFQELGQKMAATNGYSAGKDSELYITDGGFDDWMWGEQRIYSYTFEMYPAQGPAGNGGFYPPAEVIDRETSRNDKAVDLLMSYANCVPKVIGKAC